MGLVLHRIQLAKLFDDDKHFVDMSMRQPPRELHVCFLLLEPPSCLAFPPPCLPADVVQTAFYNLPTDSSAAELREFLDAYFDKPGSEFESWTPLDWHEK